MNVTLVIPPRAEGRWIGREDKHGGLGRIVIPYTLGQIHALISEQIPTANVTIVESQRDDLDVSAALKQIDDSSPDIVVSLMAWSHIKYDRVTAETAHPTICVILQQYIDQQEAIEVYDLRSKWFTKQEIEMPLIEGLKEFMDSGDIRKTPGFLINGEGGLVDTGNAPLADMNSFPMPSFDALKLERYFALREKAKLPVPRKIHLNTMKGCLFRCSFCGQANRGQGVRTQSVGQVVDQIRFLIENYDVHDFLFFDNEFAADIRRAKDICRGFIELGTPIRFEINNRVELFDQEFIDLLAKAGCIGVRCGVETCDPVTQKVLNKHIDLEKAKQTFAAVKRAGLSVHLYMTPGIPGETRETLDMNAEFIASVEADTFTYGALALMPNSDFYNEYKSKGKITEKDWGVYFSQKQLCYENSSYKSQEEIHEAQKYMLERVEALKAAKSSGGE